LALSKRRNAANCKPTPVGFEPTRGDPIGLAGRRLNHSAKVSVARNTRDHGTRTHTHTHNTTQRPNNNNAYCQHTRRCHTPIGVANDKRPRGPMDKASAHGAGDCRFESCRGHLHPAAEPPTTSNTKTTPRGFEPLRAEPNGFRVHLLNRSDTVSWPQPRPQHTRQNTPHTLHHRATAKFRGRELNPGLPRDRRKY
jgi:hypothetical protein